MGRTAKDKRDTPHPKPVEKIELSDRYVKPRLIAAIVFLAIGVTAIAMGVSALFSSEPGWHEISVSSSAEVNYGEEFVFLYHLGASGANPTVENRALTTLYTELSETAYQLFTSDQGFESVNNVYAINRHPNEALTVDGALYQAFALLDRYGDRSLYLAPAYELYDDLFFAGDDSQLVSCDPYSSAEIRYYYGQIAAYASDPASVDLELLGDGQIRLHVSEEYLAYAQENGITTLIDFTWLRNAFIVDYVADALVEQGYTLGSISSYDGFVRNLDGGDTSYSFNLYDWSNQEPRCAAVMQYSGPMSIVCLRSFPVGGLDSRHYYQLQSGEIRPPYLSAADGLPKAATVNLTSYSEDTGCAEILLQTIPIYVADAFQPDRLAALADRGIHSIYFEGSVICHNGPALLLAANTGTGPNYTVKLQ